MRTEHSIDAEERAVIQDGVRLVAVALGRHEPKTADEIYDLLTVAAERIAGRTLTPAEGRDAFCLDAARSTIDKVRRLVKAGPLEATTDAVARSLRPMHGEGVAVVIRVPLKPPTYEADELAEMTDDEIVGVFRESTDEPTFSEDAVWTVDRGTTRQEGSEG